MRSRRACTLLLLSVLGGATLDADVTVRGRIVTTETPSQIGDPALGRAAGTLAETLGKAGGGLTDFLKAAAGPKPPTSKTDDFVIYFKDGRMRMDTGSQTMALRPGRDGSPPVMLRLDHEQRQAMSMPLAAAAVAEASTQLNASPGQITALGQNRTLLGYQAEGYSFAITIESALFASPAPQAGGGAATPQVVNEGTAWLAPDVPGLDEVRAFYRIFAASMRSVGPAAATAGLVDSMAMLVERGFPLETTQKTSASIQTPMGATPLVQSTATTTVSAILLDAVTVPFYDEGPPSGYRVTSWPGAPGQPGPPGRDPGAPSQPGSRAGGEVPCECTCAAFREYRDLDARARRGDAVAKAALEARGACALQCIKTWIPCMQKEER